MIVLIDTSQKTNELTSHWKKNPFSEFSSGKKKKMFDFPITKSYLCKNLDIMLKIKE